ncbi:MAG: hypothetical protein ACKVU4_05190, partial [Phycisphaerales bacterium]
MSATTLQPDPGTPPLRGGSESPPPAPLPSAISPHPTPRPTLPGITPEDRALLAQLKSPGGLASMDDAEYAAWIERPEIQKTIAAQEELRARIQRTIDDARAERYIQRLEAVLDNAKDLTNDAQRADTRRAASLLLRLTTRPPRVILPATLARPPCGTVAEATSPLGGGDRAPRPEGAPSPRGLSSGSTSQPTTHPAAPAPADTSSLSLSVSSSLPPSPLASSIPGLPETVADFIRAAGTITAGSEAGLHEAAAHTAVHRKRALGPDLEPWLRALAQRLGPAEVTSGFTLPQDILDCAVHAVTLTRPEGPLQALVHVVLERHPDGRNIWAVADVVT